MALTFDFTNSIIEVPDPQTTLVMQDLINEIRDVEDELTPGMVNNKIADASGKEDLGGGVSTAITVRLLDSWRVRFEARGGPTTEQMIITGGNFSRRFARKSNSAFCVYSSIELKLGIGNDCYTCNSK